MMDMLQVTEKQRDKADVGSRTRQKSQMGNRIMAVQSMTDGKDGCAQTRLVIGKSVGL
jgi:hypothetical protein